MLTDGAQDNLDLLTSKDSQRLIGALRKLIKQLEEVCALVKLKSYLQTYRYIKKKFCLVLSCLANSSRQSQSYRKGNCYTICTYI